MPYTVLIDQGIRSALESSTIDEFEYYVEYMDRSRFSDELYIQHLLDFYRHKYSSVKMDLLFAVSMLAVNFMLEHGDKIFPEGPVDIALWDIAGKLHDVPIYRFLGVYRRKLPAYASTYHGEENTGYIDSPETYADFAEQCLEMGYPAFKLHVWGEPPFDRDIATIAAVGRRVGDKMDLMIDGSCAYRTFWDALQVGRACDEQGFMWVEDLMSDSGDSNLKSTTSLPRRRTLSGAT